MASSNSVVLSTVFLAASRVMLRVARIVSGELVAPFGLAFCRNPVSKRWHVLRA